MRWATIGAALAPLVMLVAPASGSPLEMFGFGGRSPGMGATGVATAIDYDCVYLNPAGLADTPRKRVTLGGVYGNFALAMDGEDTGTESAKAFIFGGALPIPLGGSMRDRVGLGLGFYVPTQAINRARAPKPGVPTFALLESRSHVVGLQVAVGVKINSRWRAGAGILALAALRGGIHISTDAAGRFTSDSEQELITRFTPILGGRYLMPEKSLTLGLTLRGPARSFYDLELTNELEDELPLTIPAIRIAGSPQYDPLTIAFEGAWHAKPSLDVLLQLAYQRWSPYPLPTLNPIEGQPAQESPGFHDTVVPRLAAEWTVLRDAKKSLVLRGGYFFFWSPAPEMTGKQSLLDNNRHVATAGLGSYWPGHTVPLRVDFWLQAHLLAPRRHTKDLNQLEPGDELPFDTIRATGRIVVGGVTVGVDL